LERCADGSFADCTGVLSGYKGLNGCGDLVGDIIEVNGILLDDLLELSSLLDKGLKRISGQTQNAVDGPISGGSLSKRVLFDCAANRLKSLMDVALQLSVDNRVDVSDCFGSWLQKIEQGIDDGQDLLTEICGRGLISSRRDLSEGVDKVLDGIIEL
jgi:hypothetical protein